MADIAAFLQGTAGGAATLLALPYPNHTDAWVLKDVPERKQLREWVKKILGPNAGDPPVSDITPYR